MTMYACDGHDADSLEDLAEAMMGDRYPYEVVYPYPKMKTKTDFNAVQERGFGDAVTKFEDVWEAKNR